MFLSYELKTFAAFVMFQDKSNSNSDGKNQIFLKI